MGSGSLLVSEQMMRQLHAVERQHKLKIKVSSKYLRSSVLAVTRCGVAVVFPHSLLS